MCVCSVWMALTLEDKLPEQMNALLLCPFSQECIADLVSADDGGNLCVWKSGEEFQLLNKITGFE